MSRIFGIIGDLFTDEKQKIKNRKENLDTFIKGINKKFNIFVKLLMSEYFNNNKSDAFQLLDSTVCKDIMIILSDKFENSLDKINFNDQSMLYQTKKLDCNSRNSCDKLLKETYYYLKKKKKVNKKELCDKIAIYHIRILNLISAILTHVDPLNNIGLQHMKTLYTFIDDENNIKISICSKEEKQIIEEYGMQQLLNIYMYNLLLNNYSQDELEKEYNNLISIFSNNVSKIIKSYSAKKISLFTKEIKDAYDSFHISLIGKSKTNNSVRNNSTINTNNSSRRNNNSRLNNETLENKKYSDIMLKLNDLYKKLENNISSNNSNNIRAKISNLENKIDELVSKNRELKEDELTKVNKKVAEIDKKFKILVELLDQKLISKENNDNEIKELQEEILKLINKLKSENDQKGGNIENSLNKFKLFLDKLNIKDSKLKEEFFDIFFNNLKIPDNVLDICKDKDKKPFIIKFNESNTEINNYLNVYNNMVDYYIEKTKEMFNILETKLITIKYNNNIIDTLKIKNLSDEELKLIEEETKKLILEFINTMHKYYIDGIIELDKYMTKRY